MEFFGCDRAERFEELCGALPAKALDLRVDLESVGIARGGLSVRTERLEIVEFRHMDDLVVPVLVGKPCANESRAVFLIGWQQAVAREVDEALAGRGSGGCEVEGLLEVDHRASRALSRVRARNRFRGPLDPLSRPRELGESRC